MPRIFIALGSNIGDREKYLRRARKMFEANGIFITRQSSIYETEPLGPSRQRWHLNQVVKAKTEFSPPELLKTLKKIEKELGKKKRGHWMSREIDLDILMYGKEIVKRQDLIIPHPEMHKRNFVLIPFAEIAPSAKHPLFKKTIKKLLDACTDDLAVKKTGG